MGSGCVGGGGRGRQGMPEAQFWVSHFSLIRIEMLPWACLDDWTNKQAIWSGSTYTWSCKEASFLPHLSQQALTPLQLLLGSLGILLYYWLYCTVISFSHFSHPVWDPRIVDGLSSSWITQLTFPYIAGMIPSSRKHEPMRYLQWKEPPFPPETFPLIKCILGCA